MKRYKAMSLILTASIMLSSLSAASFADETSVAETLEGSTSVLSDSADISISDTDVTDTSLTVSWNSVPNAETYTVICNNSIAAEGITDNRYEITDLQSGSEFFISVQAFDIAGSLISESEENVFYTNLTVDSDMKLTENLTVNSLCVDSGTLNLNGYSLTVNNDAYITDSSAYIEIGSGNLFVDGSLNFENSDKSSRVGGLKMTNSKGTACVKGDINLLSLCSGTLSAGALELCGNFNSDFTGNWDSFNTSSSHKLVLSGLDTQTITLPSKSNLSIVEIKNFSDGGVVFTNQVSISDLRDNGCKVSIESGENAIGWTLNDDEIIEGNLSLAAGTLDLKGHKLTITGDLLQSGGTVLVNGGELEVQGDYKLQSSAKVSDGILNMSNDADIVKISGDFVMQSDQSHNGKLSAGTLEIGGDLIQSGNNYNFHTTGSLMILLNGTESQTIDIDDSSVNYSRITNLKIENTSDEGIRFASCVYVVGDLYNTNSNISDSSNIYIVSSTNFTDNAWNYDITAIGSVTLSDVAIGGDLHSSYNTSITLGGDVHVKGTFFMNGDIYFKVHRLNVDGDMWIGSELYLSGGRLSVGGNLNVSEYGYIIMRTGADYICVDGDVLFYSNNRSSVFTAGTIEIKGNFTQKYDSYENNFYASGNHLVVLSGDDLQQVRFASNESRFNVLEVRNTSDAGVELYSKVQAVKIVSNDCNIRYSDSENFIRVLDDDEVIEGDLVLEDDSLDLNGHTLTITGNLIHSDGTLNINGGTLDVHGDYRIQTVNEDPSKGTLLMINESDIVRVAGDFVMESTASHKDCLTNGILEVGGDLLHFRGSLPNSGNLTVILNGSDKQTVDFYVVNNLKITNSSEGGVTFRDRVYVTGTLYNSTSVINNSEKICAEKQTVFESNEWNHSITFTENKTLPDKLRIGGDVHIFSDVSLPDDSNYAVTDDEFSKETSDNYTLSVMGNVYLYDIRGLQLNGGSVYIGKNLYINGCYAGIMMDDPDNYVLVNGSVYYKSGSNRIYGWTRGTLEVKGDFTQSGSFENRREASGEFRLVLSGNGLQTIQSESDDFPFGTIDINNHSEEGVYFASPINCVEINKNGCNIKFKYEGSNGWTLSEDEVFEGDLTIIGGTLDLNGHKLTITGDLTQPNGTVLINGGELVVEGSYYIQDKSGGEAASGDGALKMMNELDVVRVSGDFVMQSNYDKYENVLSAGTLEIGGDLLVPADGSNCNFYCSGSHTIILNGSKEQTVHIYCSEYYIKINYRYDYSRINNLKIENTSDGGVTFNGMTLVTGEIGNSTSNIINGRNICAVTSTTFENNIWNGDISFYLGGTISDPLLIKGNVYAYSWLTVNPGDVYGDDVLNIEKVNSGEYTFLVEGNVYEYGTLNLPHEGSMIVSGDIILAESQIDNYWQGSISMYSDSKLFIGGNLECSGNGSSSFSSGTLEIRGDMIFSNDKGGFKADSNHTTIFSGEKLQTVNVANSASAFDIIEIKNYSTDGVCFETPVLYSELIDNGCKVTQGINAVSGWTLNDDETIDGDLNLTSGVLDLNGYKLTVNGKFTQPGGTVFINGGELCVSGDYRIQGKRGEVYSDSLGTLKMVNESDIVKVSGSFVMQSMESHENYLSAGTLEIGGNLVTTSNFRTSGLHTVVLNGAKKQRVEISSYSDITNLMIRNTSSEGVEFANITYVTGKLYDTSSKIINGKNLYVTDTTDFVDNTWSTDICFSKTPSLLPDFYIGGSLYLNSVLTLNGDMTVDGSLYANEDINVNGHTLNVGENLQLDSMVYVNGGKLYVDGKLDISYGSSASNGYLYMNNVDDYVLVNGDVYIYSYKNTYFTRGTLEIKGDFAQKDYDSDANISFTGKVILSGTEIQKITVENARFYFKTLEVTKPIDTGYVFNRTPMWDTLIESITDTEAPTAPSKLSFISSTSTSIRIKWVGSRDNMSSCAYDVYRDGKLIAVTSDTEYIDNALIPHTEYTYYLVAHDTSGNASEQSNTLTVKTNSDVSGLLPPTNLSIKIRSDGSVYLTWSAPVNADNTVIYNVYRNGEVIGTTGSALYVDRSVEQGYHEYCVEAVDENSSAVSAGVFADNMSPAAPVISVGEIGDKRVVLNWSCEDNVGIARFELYKNGVLYRTLTNNRYVDTAVSSTSENSYYIIAYDAAGNASEVSNTVSFIAAKDTSAPKVTGLYYDLDKVSEANSDIRVSCADDISLSEFMAEVKSVNSDKWEIAYRRTVSKTSDTVKFSVLNYVTNSGDYNIRVTVKDYAGNVSIYENVFGYVKNELTYPKITAEVYGSTVQFKWTAASETMEITYYLYRRVRYGEDKCVGATSELGCTISALNPNETYEYYVVAEDAYGNTTRGSHVSVKPTNDTTDPEIFAVSSNGSTLSDGNNGIKFYCSDDVLLAGFTAEVKAGTDNKWTEITSQTLRNSKMEISFSLKNQITNSGEYELRITVKDSSGNTAVSETKFNYITNSLTSPVVTAESDGCDVTVTWDVVESGTEYSVFRVDSSGMRLVSRTNDTRFVDCELNPFTEYEYYVVVRDEYANAVSSEICTVITGKDDIAPTAYAGEDFVGVVGYPARFDAYGSQDNHAIQSYKWDFGDGSVGVGMAASHTYSETGIYTVMLTVTDESGNSDVDTTTVTIYDNDYCVVDILVTDENGTPLSGATVGCMNSDGSDQEVKFSDDDGMVTFTKKQGNYSLCIYAGMDYIPQKFDIALEGAMVGDSKLVIKLVGDSFISHKITTKKLDPTELKAMGIDLNAPENKFITEVEMTVENINTGSPEKINLLINENGEFVKFNIDGSFTTYGSIKSVKTSDRFKTQTSTSSLKFNFSKKVQYTTPQLATIVSMSVTEFSWMKDFYEVSISLTNNADEGFDIFDPEVTLNLPDGLSLAPSNKNNSATRIMNNIEGGTTQTVTWLVRGDKKGSYDISIDFKGFIEPNISIDAIFKSDDPIVVLGGDALLLTLKPTIEGTEFALTNTTDKEVLYNVKASIDSYGEFTDGIQVVAKYPSGLIEKTEWTDDSKSTVKSTVYLPIYMNIDTDILSLRTLNPGERIVGKIWYQLNDADELAG